MQMQAGSLEKKKKRATVPSDCNKTGQELASMRLAPVLPFDKIITAERM